MEEIFQFRMLFQFAKQTRHKYLNKKGKHLCVAVIDFQRAFDSVDRNILFTILTKDDIKGNLFKAIKSIYNEVKCYLETKLGNTDTLCCLVGLRLGLRLVLLYFS